jgi:hypothetical protein
MRKVSCDTMRVLPQTTVYEELKKCILADVQGLEVVKNLINSIQYAEIRPSKLV